MKTLLFLAFIFIAFKESFAQGKEAFKLLRYDEDYSSLKNDTAKSWYNKMKYTPLSKTGNTFLSIGGEVRFQYFYFKNEDWGDAPKDSNGYVLSRYLTHADFRAGKHFRTFVQLQSSLANDKLSTSPVDENALELHQAFVYFKLGSKPTASLTFRVGRQELSYGSQRLISVRELPNNRQSFDGLKTILTSGNYKLDFLYTQYVTAKKGIFNDGISDKVKLWGAYLTRNEIPFLQNIDLYYLGLQKTKTTFDDGSGTETRHSIGTRIWNSKNNWQYDVEGVFQWGTFAVNNISAWTASTNIFYVFDLKSKALAGLKTELISGDKNYNDGKLNTFNPLFPRGAYFGLAAWIGPSNLFDVHPYIEFPIHKSLVFKADVDLFWRMSENDGIYGPNVQVIYSGKGHSSKKIGQQLGTELTYTPNPFLNFRGEFTWFKTDDYLKQASAGKDILMAGITGQLKF